MRGGAYGIAQIISAREKFIGGKIVFCKRTDRRAELNPVACFNQWKHGMIAHSHVGIAIGGVGPYKQALIIV